jgi:hypothetical protein
MAVFSMSPYGFCSPIYADFSHVEYDNNLLGTKIESPKNSDKLGINWGALALTFAKINFTV